MDLTIEDAILAVQTTKTALAASDDELKNKVDALDKAKSDELSAESVNVADITAFDNALVNLITAATAARR